MQAALNQLPLTATTCCGGCRGRRELLARYCYPPSLLFQALGIDWKGPMLPVLFHIRNYLKVRQNPLTKMTNIHSMAQTGNVDATSSSMCSG